MRLNNRKWFTFAAALGFVVAMQPVFAKVDIEVDFDKKFDFKPIKTWSWNPAGPGQLKMARTQTDDPEAMRKLAEPIIIDAVTTEAPKRGLTAGDPGDLTVTYYLLLSTNMETQTLGQFLPATTAWALPPFEQTTQSMKLMNRGSLVLDLSAKGNVVWRGVARANISFDADAKKRADLIREAVRGMLSKYPPKK